MNRETTLINAGELFGDFADHSQFQDCRNGFEKRWVWPKEIGNGFMSMIKLRPGLFLGLGDFHIIKNIAVSFEQIFYPVTFDFCTTRHRNYTINYKKNRDESWGVESGYGFIAYQPEWYGTIEYPLEIPILSISILIDPSALNSFIDEQYYQFPTELYAIINGARKRSFEKVLTVTPSINMVINQLFNCPYRGALKRSYLESKTQELITHAMGQLAVNKNSHGQKMIGQPEDMKHVWDAKDVLLNNLDKPPSLLELAKQVGSNKTTLNQGFRQVFGASVFEYLRIHRLERARELLENKKMNVTETAFEVGYEHPKNFARAFKKHFGTNPKDHLC